MCNVHSYQFGINLKLSNLMSKSESGLGSSLKQSALTNSASLQTFVQKKKFSNFECIQFFCYQLLTLWKSLQWINLEGKRVSSFKESSPCIRGQIMRWFHNIWLKVGKCVFCIVFHDWKSDYLFLMSGFISAKIWSTVLNITRHIYVSMCSYVCIPIWPMPMQRNDKSIYLFELCAWP